MAIVHCQVVTSDDVLFCASAIQRSFAVVESHRNLEADFAVVVAGPQGLRLGGLAPTDRSVAKTELQQRLTKNWG